MFCELNSSELLLLQPNIRSDGRQEMRQHQQQHQQQMQMMNGEKIM